jgi:hypothetical protein
MTFFLLMCPALPLVHRQESVEALVLQHGRRECDSSQNLTLSTQICHKSLWRGELCSISRQPPFQKPLKCSLVLTNACSLPFSVSERRRQQVAWSVERAVETGGKVSRTLTEGGIFQRMGSYLINSGQENAQIERVRKDHQVVCDDFVPQALCGGAEDDHRDNCPSSHASLKKHEGTLKRRHA